MEHEYFIIQLPKLASVDFDLKIWFYSFKKKT